ncbi:hypothetical protein FHT72_006984 [Rhizobium sp. BK077]|uniref:hypothetical protein n=1 Tax=unclassified Rhizobium TaxID=2613769 RepID=UPI001614DFE9|nr:MULTISPECIES: hypothetical protein [unclassified Rhizobium]MBB3303292.1 hypothetical protein [Rhizobium sp. BK112]MBB3372445.1 hypothetical protein [Rhizobium sp. BK077]MBB4183150.1 hypothetical protein [Rhizobium sp. BK109]
MRLFRSRIAAVILLCVPVSGCFGVTIPEMQTLLENSDDQRDKENTLVNLVKCQLKQGVSSVLHEYSSEGPGKGYDASWINDWAAKVTFTLTANETSKFSPNFSYTNHPEVFSLALGADAGADATRTETTALTWSVPEILSDAATIPCKHFGPFKVTSDLQIAEWLQRKAFLARVPGNIDRQKLDTPFSVFNYEAIFVSTYGGGINPGWSFNRRTVNDNTTFFNLSRSRTDSVNITMGPASKDEFGNYQLARDAEDVRLATLIGQAVRGQ